jgi:hypothetical protein
MNSTTSPAQSPLKEIANPDVGALFKELSSSPDGLTGVNAKKRLEKYGTNVTWNSTQSGTAIFWNGFKSRCIRTSLDC